MKYDFDTLWDRSETDAEKNHLCLKLYGTEDVIPLWVADMDYPSPSVVVDAMKERLRHPLLGYTAVGEDVVLAVQWWMKKQHEITFGPREILLSPSVVASIASAIDAFADQGRGVAGMTPVYGPFHSYPKKHGVEWFDTPLLIKNGRHEIDFASLENLFATGKIALFLFCNPHNPGGRVWSREEVSRIVELCISYDVILFSDEIHSDLVYSDIHFTSVLSIEGAEKIAILAHSIGKTFNCSGLNGSFVIIPDRSVRYRFLKSQQKFHTDEINLMAKVAMKAAFSPEGVEYKQEVMKYLEGIKDEACKIIQESEAPIEVMVPDSTFLLWLNFRNTGLSHDEISHKLVQDAKVGLTSGKFFGKTGEGWFRINIAHPRKELLQIIRTICSTFA